MARSTAKKRNRNFSPAEQAAQQESAAIQKILDERSPSAVRDIRIYAINPSHSIEGKDGAIYTAPAEGDAQMISSDYLTPAMEQRYYATGAIRLAYESIKPKGRRVSFKPVELNNPMAMLSDDSGAYQGQGGIPVLRSG